MHTHTHTPTHKHSFKVLSDKAKMKRVRDKEDGGRYGNAVLGKEGEQTNQ